MVRFSAAGGFPVCSRLSDLVRHVERHSAVASWHMLKECRLRSAFLEEIAQFRLTHFSPGVDPNPGSTIDITNQLRLVGCAGAN